MPCSSRVPVMRPSTLLPLDPTDTPACWTCAERSGNRSSRPSRGRPHPDASGYTGPPRSDDDRGQPRSVYRRPPRSGRPKRLAARATLLRIRYGARPTPASNPVIRRAAVRDSSRPCCAAAEASPRISEHHVVNMPCLKSSIASLATASSGVSASPVSPDSRYGVVAGRVLGSPAVWFVPRDIPRRRPHGTARGRRAPRSRVVLEVVRSDRMIVDQAVDDPGVRCGTGAPEPGVRPNSFRLRRRRRGAVARSGWARGRARIHGSARSGPPPGRGALFAWRRVRRRSAKATGATG